MHFHWLLSTRQLTIRDTGTTAFFNVAIAARQDKATQEKSFLFLTPRLKKITKWK